MGMKHVQNQAKARAAKRAHVLLAIKRGTSVGRVCVHQTPCKKGYVWPNVLGVAHGIDAASLTMNRVQHLQQQQWWRPKIRVLVRHLAGEAAGVVLRPYKTGVLGSAALEMHVQLKCRAVAVRLQRAALAVLLNKVRSMIELSN